MKKLITGTLCYAIQVDMEPWHFYDPKTSIYHIINRVKNFTSSIATQNAAPFLHRYLYRSHTPKCILTCFSVSVLYANRTPANMPMVMRAIHSGVKELVDGETGRSGLMACVGGAKKPIDRLARTQAMLLYQIIRLLDGNITLRAQAERDIPLLNSWLGDLCKVRENLGDVARLGNSTARTQPPADWDVS